jgi:small multidrug resistance pump
MSWVYLLIAIVCEVAGSTALKKVDGFNNPIPLAIVVFGYGFAIYFLTLTIKTMSLGVTYAIWSGVGIICISILGWIFYKQKLDLAAIIGIGFILAGVVIINLFSKTIHCD